MSRQIDVAWGSFRSFKIFLAVAQPMLPGRLIAHCKLVSARLTATLSLVCPHQGGARALAQCLERVFNFVVIMVPKEVLDFVEEHGPDKAYAWFDSSYDHTPPTWFQQLSSLQSNLLELKRAELEPKDHNKIIVVDEINVSGNTRSQLRLLVESLQLGALGYISLVDFNPNDPRIDITNSFSLYDIEIPDAVWQSE